MDEGQFATPSEQPIYGVNVSEAAIRTIVEKALPDAGGNIVVEPEKFASFNNRIYAISCGIPAKKYILKVNGRFFGAAKVENEVGCLLLNETFCPTVPVPRVIAWSGEGKTLSRRVQDGKIVASPIDGLEQDNIPGWILITRVAGKPLELAKLTPAQTRSIIDQFEPHPAASSRYKPAARTSLPNLYIYGIQGMGKGLAPPMGSMLEFWQHNLRCLTDELVTEEVFAPNKEPLGPMLQDCIDKTLPQLSVLKTNQAHEFVFTHADLAPRNVIVSEYYPSVITGVVDFEFCGFFPTWSQFFAYVTNDSLLNEEGNHNPDWPVEIYRSFVKRLSEQGVATPYGHESSREWKELVNLMRLELNIAPWWLEGAGDGKEEALGKARKAIDIAVERLRSLSGEEVRRQ